MNVYLDNSATTKPCPAVIRMAGELMESGWYNPSALYRPALEVQKRMEEVRTLCLTAAGASGGQVIFTSGGTESDNLALLGHLKTRRGGKVLISSVEHPAVSSCTEEIRRMGFAVAEIPAGKDGRIDLRQLEQMLDEETVMISVMQVNNETGGIEPLEGIAALRNLKAPKAAIHVDGVQGFLRVPMQMNRLEIQSYSFSGHKIHGLKGSGGLIIRKDHAVRPVQYGGGQEKNYRSGTENTPGILTMGEAIRDWKPEYSDTIRRTKIRLWSEIKNRIPDAAVNGPDPESDLSAPHILNVALEPVRSQTMLFALEGDGILVSAGSACASRKQKISPVLKAMGVSVSRADCSIRFSLGRYSTEDEMVYVAERVAAQYETLKRYVRR